MSNEQSVFDDIVKKTQSNSISWNIVSNSHASHLIFQPGHIYRIFKTEYSRDGHDFYEVLLIEKKYGDPEWDFAVEKYKVEIAFIQNGILIASLDEYTIDFSSLVNLARLVESKSSQAQKLFGL